MQDNILVMTYNLNFIIKRLEKLIYDKSNYEVERQLKIINEKIYELSNTIEMVEVMLE